MTKQLQPLSIPGPGSWGLNTEEQRKEIDPRWAIKAQNAVVSDSGVLAARKGWKAQNGSAVEDSNGDKVPFQQIHEYLDSAEKTAIVFTGDNKIYEDPSSPTDISGSITTPSADNWTFVNFKGKLIGFLEAHKPIIKDGVGTGNTFSDVSPTSGSVPQGGAALAAYGRLWASDDDGTTVKWSDLLDHDGWDAGSSGSLDTYSVWTTGSDEIIALAAFKDRLVIFGKREILIYTGTASPTSTDFVLEDSIKNIGCVARDSVQNIGDDILFLSDNGLQSLSRAIQGGDLPLESISRNVFSDLMSNFAAETPSNVKSAYFQQEGLYLLSMPSSNRVWVFDVAHRLPETGLPRVTTWTGMTPNSLTGTRGNNLYFGQTGYIGLYGGGTSTEEFQDDGSPYRFEVRTGRTSGQQSPLVKVPKFAKSSVTGGFGQTVTMVWDLDFKDFTGSSQGTLESGTASFWEVDTWEDSFWSDEFVRDEVVFPLEGMGNNMTIEHRLDIDGDEFILHRTDVFLKAGRLG